MKRLIALCSIFASLHCMAQPSQADFQDLQNYANTNHALAKSGQLPWSTYYKNLFSRLAALNAPTDLLDRTNRLIRYSEQYESGQIDKEYFQSRQSIIQAEQTNSDAARRTELIAQRRADEIPSDPQGENQRQTVLLGAAAALMQAGAPRMLPQQPSMQLPPATGMMGFLQSQSVNGMLRYCRYSNGVVNTINSMNLCPLNTQ